MAETPGPRELALQAGLLAVRGAILKALAIVAVLVVILGTLVVLVIIPAGSKDWAREDCATGGGGGDAPVDAPTEVRAEQIKIAKQIDAAAQALGLNGQASRLGIITGYAESTLENLDHGDEAGPDSRGVFQQRANWGTEAERMDVDHAARSFFAGPAHDGSGGLVAVDGWADMEPTEAIHQVQGNANSQHYAAYYAVADQIILEAGIDPGRPGSTTLGGGEEGGSSGGGPSEDCGTGGTPGEGEHDEGDDYPWSGTPESAGMSPLLYVYGNCTDFAAFRLNRDDGVTGIPWRWTWSELTPGDGNAKSWGGWWDAHGWPRDNTPDPGDIAMWTDGGYGHVAYVQRVNDDGTVFIEEYNWAVDGVPDNAYHTRTIQAGEPASYLSPPPGS